MATIVNTPAHEHYHEERSSSMGWVVGLVVVLAVLFLLFYYGLPLVRQATTPPQVNVPSQVDVNVKPQAPAPAQPGQ